MSETQDIRVWAVENGWDISTKGRVATEVKEAYAKAHDGNGTITGTIRPAPEAEEIPFVITPGASDTTPPEQPAKTPPDERKPEQPRRKGWLARQDKTHKRVSIENVLSSGWAFGAMALARRPEAIPVARVMNMQAPVAGIIGEELLKGTLVDKILQPFARGGRKAELGMALVGPPVLVGVMTARPELHNMLRPMLKMTMMSWMEISEPAMKKITKRAEDWAEKFGEVDIDGMIDALWLATTQPSPQEEENIRKARGE